MTDNLFVAARKASGINQAKAASICGLATGTYSDRERDPMQFRLAELHGLYESYGSGARMVLKSAIDSIFLD